MNKSVCDGHIEFQGLPNTRDLGGTRVVQGRCIRPGRLLRSGALIDATKSDCSLLVNTYNLRTVVDLRTEEERRDKPDPACLNTLTFVNAPVLSASTFGITHEGGAKEMLKKWHAFRNKPKELMQRLYAHMMLDAQCQEGFRSFFGALLSTEDGAVLWHCTLGKDRAGLASALLLYALGASFQTIVDDYLATNKYLNAEKPKTLQSLEKYHLGSKLDESMRIVYSADETFLQAAFSAIKQEYGNVGTYLSRALQISDDEIQLLRLRYLSPNL